jgi:hypothetical protein
VNAERLRSCIYPIFLDIEKRRDNSPVGAIRNVIFSNIIARSDNGILMQGMRESHIENLILQNILLRVTRGFDYSQRRKHAGGTSNPKDDRITRYARQPSYCTLAHVRNLTVDNLNVQVDQSVLEAFPRSALALLNSEGAMLKSIYRSPCLTGGPVLDLYETREVSVTACRTPPGTETFLRLHGMRKDDIAVTGNDLRGAKRALQWK